MNSGLTNIVAVLVGIEVLGLCLLAVLVGPYIDSDLMPLLSKICIIQYTLHLVILAAAKGIGIVSMPFLYAASLSLYVVGPFILYLSLGQLGLIYFRFIDYAYLTGCLPLVMLSIASFTFGVLAWRIERKPAPKVAMAQVLQLAPPSRRRLEVMTSLVMLMLIAFSLLIIGAETAAGRGLAPMLKGNYHEYSDARKDGQQSRLFVASMTWFLPIASLTYNAIRKQCIRRLGWSDALFFALLSIPLIAGDRGNMIATFAGWLVIHQAICRNITAMKLYATGAAIIVLVPLLEVLRGLAASDWSLSVMIDIATNLSSSDDKFAGSTLLSFLGPFSPALMTTMGTLMRVEMGEPLRLGTDYIRGALAAIPLNSGMAPNNSGQIHDFLIPGRKGGPGFMALAEMYINFHVPGVAAGHAALGYLCIRIHRTMRDGRMSAHNLAFAGVFFFSILIWVRNEFSFVMQICFLFVVLAVLLPRLAGVFLPWKPHSAARPLLGPKD